MQIEIGRIGFGFGSDTPCHAYGKGGGSLRAFRRARWVVPYTRVIYCTVEH